MKASNKKKNQEIKKDLVCITETLVKQSGKISIPGLLYGKMGLVVFFFHYARYTDDPSFEEHAMILMDNIREQILHEQEIDYACGLAGIGTGVEYLVQNKFIEANTNEILEDMDKMISHEIIHRNHTDMSLHAGLTGLGRYLLFRIAGHSTEEHINILNNKMLLVHITDILERKMCSFNELYNDDVAGFLNEMRQTGILPVKIERMFNHFSFGYPLLKTEDRLHSCQMKRETLCHARYKEILSKIRINPCQGEIPGLYGGLAGVGMYLLSQLDKQHERWIKLL